MQQPPLLPPRCRGRGGLGGIEREERGTRGGWDGRGWSVPHFALMDAFCRVGVRVVLETGFRIMDKGKGRTIGEVGGAGEAVG